MTFMITVNPSITMKGVANQDICAGANTMPINFESPFTSLFTWTNSNPDIGLAASGTGYIPAFIGVNNTQAPISALITVSPIYTQGGANCPGIPITFTLTINPAVNIQSINAVAAVCRTDSTVQLIANPAGGTWAGKGVVGNTFSPRSAGAGIHTISYTLTNATGCSSTMTTTITVNDCIDCQSPLYRSITIYPNPNNGYFKFKLNSDLFEDIDMKVFNDIGQDIGTFHFTKLFCGSVIPVDLHWLPSATYFLVFHTKLERVTHKVVIIH